MSERRRVSSGRAIVSIMGGPGNDALNAGNAPGVRQEEGAAMMARACARARGLPAACAGACFHGTIKASPALPTR
jgi:thiamine pyrophosphate-dependent acetolactate synthase large subunit-like protein